MPKYKQYLHISFDVWNTLIKANKKFASTRNQMISNVMGVRLDVVQEQYSITKANLDTVAHKYGIGCTTHQAFQQLVERLSMFHNYEDGVDLSSMWNPNVLIRNMRENINRLFREHPPIVDQATINAVHSLYSAGISMNISSNSNFVAGTEMRPFLEKTFGADTFDFFLFSDEMGVAKPSFQFFDQVRKNIATSPDAILHVGDDERYDRSSELVGIRYARVDDHATAAKLTNLILSKKY